MDGASSLHVVTGNGQLIGQLLAAEDESDLLDVDAFFFLQCLLDLQNGILRIKIELLLSTRQGLYH